MHGTTSDEANRPGAGSSPRLYERVIDILSAEIAGGILTSGDLITETSVAYRFGISRAPARRALAELQRAGVLDRTEPRGFVPRAPAGGGSPAPHQFRPIGEKLVPTSSWEAIYGEVEGEIIARVSFGSWRLNEAKLARHYRVSRTVSRDVIGRLQQRGVVRKDDRSRWYAPALSPTHVGELYELRWLLEPVALVKAAPHLPDGLLAQVRGRLVAAIDDPAAVDGDVLDSLERDLHVSVLSMCSNGALMQAIMQPQSLLVAHRFLYRWTARMFEREPFLPEHLEVVDSLIAGHTAEAAAALEHHLRVSSERALSRIEAITAGAQPEPLDYLERME